VRGAIVILVCAMARRDVDGAVRPRKCRMLTRFSNPARPRLMNSSALP